LPQVATYARRCDARVERHCVYAWGMYVWEPVTRGRGLGRAG